MGSVLIIEDDDDFRDNLANLIRRKGYVVITAAHGEAALDKLEDWPSVILLDLMMPVMDGWAFCARVMRDPILALIPIVVLSGVSNIEGEWKKLHVADYIGKPVNLDKLYRVLEQHAA